MAERDQTNRWRCCVTGCNPNLIGEAAANAHRDETGHRIAKWPIRSAEGKRRARARNRGGYYDKYNVGAKSAEARGLTRRRPYSNEFVLSGEDFSLDSAGPFGED